ncbi:hypothetical protein NLJ89_g2765 [Agrocybe chaxingu]|uniref:Uncharacterized protein n=1 Tax=Agrocybe chaxingu TaxID=84603 RepID=A0A9W8MW55_9AGAR|nr:hypothetical protein NLJ89_g2765 [Agrocybe chaxingu]
MGLIDLRVGTTIGLRSITEGRHLILLSFQDGYLPTCLPLRIDLSVAAPPAASKSASDHQYPHSLAAFVIGGIAETIPLDPERFRDILWTVTYPVGTKVIFGLTDGDGRSVSVIPMVFEVVASVTDATGTWVSGTGVPRFRDYAKAESQNVLQRRDSPTNSQGLTTILIVEIVALALLLLGATLCAIQAILKRRARRRGGSNGKTSGIPLGSVNDHDAAERQPSAIVPSSPRSSTLHRQSLATESVLSRFSLKPEDINSPPPVPPTTPTTANFTESPLPTPLSMSSSPSTWPGVTPQLTNFPDAAYGDPYPSSSVSGSRPAAAAQEKHAAELLEFRL